MTHTIYDNFYLWETYTDERNTAPNKHHTTRQRRRDNMNKYTFTDKNGATWERVTRLTAKKQFINGAQVLFIPSNLRPFTPWHCEIITSLEEEKNGIWQNETPAEYFERFVLYFTAYNCMNTETGKHPAFYIRQEANA